MLAETFLGLLVLESNFLLAAFWFTANESGQCALRSNEGSCIPLCNELFNFDKPLPRTGGTLRGASPLKKHALAYKRGGGGQTDRMAATTNGIHSLAVWGGVGRRKPWA